MNIFISIILIIISYLLGSIPNGLWVGKALTNKDVREYGSKNIGTTNCIRVFGKKIGLFIFFLDVLKGMVIIILVKYLKIIDTPSFIPAIVYGVAAIMGHSFSIFLNFKGGKSVAVSLGVVLSLTPIPAISCLVVFYICLKLTGYVSICSSFAALTVVISAWILRYTGSDTSFFFLKPELHLCIVYTIVASFLIYKHKTNFIRLLNGTENSFKKNK